MAVVFDARNLVPVVLGLTELKVVAFVICMQIVSKSQLI